MTLLQLQDFLFWSMVVNFGLYLLTVIAVFALKDFICALHQKLFGFDQSTTLQSMHRYIANYKLMIIVFNFAPWIATLMIL